MSIKSSKQTAPSATNGDKANPKGGNSGPPAKKGGPFQRPTAPATHFKGVGFRGIVGKVNHHVPEIKVAVIAWGTRKHKPLAIYQCGTTCGIGARKGKRRRSAMLAKGIIQHGKAVSL
jgi:hypothetical protein